jgi:hypothetical protein
VFTTLKNANKASFLIAKPLGIDVSMKIHVLRGIGTGLQAL